MAMVILNTALVTEIEGRFGGLIYWVDQCGQHARIDNTFVGPPRPPTEPQRAQRFAYRQALNAWLRHPWTNQELEAWRIYASTHPKRSRKGKITYLPPFNMFMSVNIKRINADLDITYVPPTD